MDTNKEEDYITTIQKPRNKLDKCNKLLYAEIWYNIQPKEYV